MGLNARRHRGQFRGFGAKLCEERGRRPDDGVSVTLIAAHFADLKPLLSPEIHQRVRAFVLCDGNCGEAAFRAGCNREAVRYAAKAAMREIHRLVTGEA